MSALDQQFVARGLTRIGKAGRLLHCADVKQFINSGHIKAETVTWDGHTFQGVSDIELERAHARLWPNGCPWQGRSCTLTAPQ